MARAGLSGRIGLAKVAPGPLPFPPATFDVVFSKDSIVHIPDKHALMAEVARVLRPGGWLLASDWLIGQDGPPSEAMRAYMEAEALDFGMASPARYRDACAAAGMVEVETRDRNPWYREVARGANETETASEQVRSSAESLSQESNRLKLEVDKFLATVRAA